MELLPFDEYVRSLNRKRMAAGVLFRDDADRVLIVEPSYKEDWEIPGGACDEDEPPWRTAEREIGEELGITRPPGRLIAIDYLPSDERMPEGLTFVFDGGVITDEDLAEIESSSRAESFRGTRSRPVRRSRHLRRRPPRQLTGAT